MSSKIGIDQGTVNNGAIKDKPNIPETNNDIFKLEQKCATSKSCPLKADAPSKLMNPSAAESSLQANAPLKNIPKPTKDFPVNATKVNTLNGGITPDTQLLKSQQHNNTSSTHLVQKASKTGQIRNSLPKSNGAIVNAPLSKNIPLMTLSKKPAVPSIQPKPLTSHPIVNKTIAPNVQPVQRKPAHFHPIAIKPKPVHIQPNKLHNRSTKVTSGNVTGLRLNSESTITSSGSIKDSTPSTSKNWVLPPRPKPKKILKKKEKDTNARKVIKKINSNYESNKINTQKVTTTSTNPETLKKIIIKSESPASMVGGDTTNLCNKSKTAPSLSEFSIPPGVRSVKFDSLTGKITISSQIHSNINLYTDNEIELDSQLQHVTCENDNLKKILAKLNKEIGNLKLIKDKTQQSPHSQVEFTSKIEAFPIAAEAHTIDPVNLSYNLDPKRQKVVCSKQASISVKPNPMKASTPVSSTFSNKLKRDLKKKVNSKSSSTIVDVSSKKRDPTNSCVNSSSAESDICGIKADENVTPISTDTVLAVQPPVSIVNNIAQLLKRGGTNLLGIGSVASKSMVNQNVKGRSILEQDDVMIKLKDSARMNLELDTGKSDSNGLSRVINSEFTLSPALINPVQPATVKKNNAFAVPMKNSDSKNSDIILDNDVFNRGTLMDFNTYSNQIDTLVTDDDVLFDVSNEYADINIPLDIPISDDPTDFMIY